jgi:hypothetical protein
MKRPTVVDPPPPLGSPVQGTETASAGPGCALSLGWYLAHIFIRRLRRMACTRASFWWALGTPSPASRVRKVQAL